MGHIPWLRSPATLQEKRAIVAAETTTDELQVPWRNARKDLPTDWDDLPRSCHRDSQHKVLRLKHRRVSRQFITALKLGETTLLIEPKW